MLGIYDSRPEEDNNLSGDPQRKEDKEVESEAKEGYVDRGENRPHYKGDNNVVDSFYEPQRVEHKPDDHCYRHSIEEGEAVQGACKLRDHFQYYVHGSCNQPHKQNTESCDNRAVFLFCGVV